MYCASSTNHCWDLDSDDQLKVQPQICQQRRTTRAYQVPRDSRPSVKASAVLRQSARKGKKGRISILLITKVSYQKRLNLFSFLHVTVILNYEVVDENIGRIRGNGTSAPTTTATTPGSPSPPDLSKALSASRKNRTIVLGSSGEVLPVTRKSIAQTSVYDSINSQSTDSFHSAKDTIDEELG